MLDRGLAARPQLLVRCSASQTIPHTSTISKRNFMPCCFLGGSKSGRKPAPACSSMTGAKSTNPVDDQMIDNNEVMNGEEMCIAVRLGLPPLLSVESLERGRNVLSIISRCTAPFGLSRMVVWLQCGSHSSTCMTRKYWTVPNYASQCSNYKKPESSIWPHLYPW